MSRFPRWTRAGVVLALVAAALTVAGASPASAASAYLAGNDYCLGQCYDILPPGENGNATLADILAHQTLGTRPAHSDRPARPTYANLLNAYTGLTTTRSTASTTTPRSGYPRARSSSTESPRSDVTIVRDKATGSAARHRHHPGRHHVRGRVRGRRGPAVPDGPAAPRRARHADLVRRRLARQPGAGAERLAQLAVHRGGPAGPGRRVGHGRAPAARSCTPTCSQLRGRRQRVHQRTAWRSGRSTAPASTS